MYVFGAWGWWWQLTSPVFALSDDGDSDKLSNVNTGAVQALTSSLFLSLSYRDLKIENLLLDEQDNIKLIGNSYIYSI